MSGLVEKRVTNIIHGTPFQIFLSPACFYYFFAYVLDWYISYIVLSFWQEEGFMYMMDR